MERDLIGAYVEALRTSLRWRRDVQDVVDEVADHLRENVARLVATGAGDDEAQRRTLECFGDLGLVARSFAQTAAGGLAVPTRTTRAAGLLGVGAGFAWAAALVSGALGGHTELLVAWTLPRYVLWNALLILAAALTTATFAGALLRAGQLRGPVSAVVVGVGVLLCLALVRLGWAVTFVITPLALAALAAASRLGPAADAIARPMRVFGVAWLIGAVALVLGDEVYPIGPVDSYGDHPVAWLVPFVLCAACSAGCLALIGVRLRADQPADLDSFTSATPLAG